MCSRRESTPSADASPPGRARPAWRRSARPSTGGRLPASLTGPSRPGQRRPGLKRSCQAPCRVMRHGTHRGASPHAHCIGERSRTGQGEALRSVSGPSVHGRYRRYPVHGVQATRWIAPAARAPVTAPKDMHRRTCTETAGCARGGLRPDRAGLVVDPIGAAARADSRRRGGAGRRRRWHGRRGQRKDRTMSKKAPGNNDMCRFTARREVSVKGGEKPDQRAEQNTATAAVGVRWSEGVGMRPGAVSAGNEGRA